MARKRRKNPILDTPDDDLFNEDTKKEQEQKESDDTEKESDDLKKIQRKINKPHKLKVSNMEDIKQKIAGRYYMDIPGRVIHYNGSKITEEDLNNSPDLAEKLINIGFGRFIKTS